MMTDTFLFLELLRLLLMLFCLFELVTTFFLLCSFKVVISCFGMLSLLWLRLNFSEFPRMFIKEMSSLLFGKAENWFDEVVSWSGTVITWFYACLFVVSLWLLLSVENLLDETMSRSEIFIARSSGCYITFLEAIVPAFLCSFNYVFKIVLDFDQRLNNRRFIFVFLTKMMNLF